MYIYIYMIVYVSISIRVYLHVGVACVCLLIHVLISIDSFLGSRSIQIHIYTYVTHLSICYALLCYVVRGPHIWVGASEQSAKPVQGVAEVGDASMLAPGFVNFPKTTI